MNDSEEFIPSVKSFMLHGPRSAINLKEVEKGVDRGFAEDSRTGDARENARLGLIGVPLGATAEYQLRCRVRVYALNRLCRTFGFKPVRATLLIGLPALHSSAILGFSATNLEPFELPSVCEGLITTPSRPLHLDDHTYEL